ncbi:MAG: serine hydrolase domain-containing protein, partial [Promethearchaeota archaeon]
MMFELNKSNIAKIDGLIAKEIAKMKIGGLSYAIIKDGEIVHKQGFGAKNLDKNLPADENTIYNIASVTKSFICTAIMILVEEGKLDITDPAKKYIPLELGTESNPITIQHLMNHTSGIPDLANTTLFYYMAREGLKIPPKAKLVPMSSENDFFRVINNGLEYSHEIDQYFHYNNFAYSMLALIINKVSGKEYREFIKERIFEPLGMKSTTFFPEEFKDNENLAQSYHVNLPDKGGNTRKIERFEERWFFSAAGGIYSCVKDMTVYMLMHLGKGTYKDVKIISKESSNLMQTNSLKPGTMAEKVISNSSPLKSVGYGFGFFIDSNFYGFTSVRHGGNMFGGTADFQFIPSLNIGIVALANNLFGPRPVISSILAMIAGTPEEEIHFLVER